MDLAREALLEGSPQFRRNVLGPSGHECHPGESREREGRSLRPRLTETCKQLRFESLSAGHRCKRHPEPLPVNLPTARCSRERLKKEVGTQAHCRMLVIVIENGTSPTSESLGLSQAIAATPADAARCALGGGTRPIKACSSNAAAREEHEATCF